MSELFVAPPLPDAREFRRNEGFVYATHMGHAVMDRVIELPLEKAVSDEFISKRGGFKPDEAPSAAALYLVAHAYEKRIDHVFNTDVAAKVGCISADEKVRARFGYADGLGDNSFTAHFAPVMAQHAVRQLVHDGFISAEQHAALTLGDWANVIGSRWFSDFMHDMALAGNGIYRRYGKDLYDYYSNYERSLSLDVRVPNGAYFRSNYKYEPSDDESYMTVELQPEFRRKLRETMSAQPASVGCPVARHTGTLATDTLTSDGKRHLRTLETDYEIKLEAPRPDGKQRFRQDYTPIDRALDALALQIDRYDEAHGTPTFTTNPYSFKHVHATKTNALLLAGNVQLSTETGTR